MGETVWQIKGLQALVETKEICQTQETWKFAWFCKSGRGPVSSVKIKRRSRAPAPQQSERSQGGFASSERKGKGPVNPRGEGRVRGPKKKCSTTLGALRWRGGLKRFLEATVGFGKKLTKGGTWEKKNFGTIPNSRGETRIFTKLEKQVAQASMKEPRFEPPSETYVGERSPSWF